MRVVKLDNFTKSQKPWEGVEWREVRLGEIAKKIKSGWSAPLKVDTRLRNNKK